MQTQPSKRVLVTGGTGFLGYRVVKALIEQGMSVTALVAPNSDDRLKRLPGQVQCIEGDVWNPASLRGRGRGHDIVIHMVGGFKADPARGMTFRHLNYVSSHNIAQMAMSDGVQHIILVSAAAAPLGVPRAYLESKRDAEGDLNATGLAWTVVRAPTLYIPGTPRPGVYRLISIISYIPLLGWLIRGYRPMQVEVAAYGIASLALSAKPEEHRIIGPNKLRRLGRAQRHLMRRAKSAQHASDEHPDISDDKPDEPPFGWSPRV